MPFSQIWCAVHLLNYNSPASMINKYAVWDSWKLQTNLSWRRQTKQSCYTCLAFLTWCSAPAALRAPCEDKSGWGWLMQGSNLCYSICLLYLPIPREAEALVWCLLYFIFLFRKMIVQCWQALRKSQCCVLLFEPHTWTIEAGMVSTLKRTIW